MELGGFTDLTNKSIKLIAIVRCSDSQSYWEKEQGTQWLTQLLYFHKFTGVILSVRARPGGDEIVML